jgi:hypothetical protein
MRRRNGAARVGVSKPKFGLLSAETATSRTQSVAREMRNRSRTAATKLGHLDAHAAAVASKALGRVALRLLGARPAPPGEAEQAGEYEWAGAGLWDNYPFNRM